MLSKKKIDWKCQKTWRRASKNTMWCLLGCAIGDMGTILFFQITEIAIHPLSLLILAMTNGILFSIGLETLILVRQMKFVSAFKTACGMSLISMISMEISMNLVDFLFVGELKLTMEVILTTLFCGFFHHFRITIAG